MSHTLARRIRSAHWLFGGLSFVLNAAIVYLVVSLAAESRAPMTEGKHRINVPYENEAALWESWRRWVVQEDGRNKPFDTFCRESVRAITGRERFEEVRSSTTGHVLAPGHDPVAVVTSWLMLEGTEGDTAATCDWELYPFILCRNKELRRLLYEDPHTPLTEEQLAGQHVEPAVLRGSPTFLQVLRRAFANRERDSRAPLPLVEREAIDVQGRLELYDRIRAGGEVEDGRGRPRLPGEFQVLALDRGNPAWFSLATLRAFANAQGQEHWDQALQYRRLDNPELYGGRSARSLPTEEVQQILDSYFGVRKAYRSGDAALFAESSERFLGAVAAVNRRFDVDPNAEATETELWYNRVNPFRKAWLFDLAGALLFTIGLVFGARWRWAGRIYYGAGLLAAVCCLGWATTGFVCRVAIAGRPPVSNMYESIIWVAFMALVFGLLLEAIYRRGVIVLAAALVSTLGFVLADQLPLTFSPALQPLQAVLRSNYWLVVHVLPMVSSYAPFALAWSLGNLTLGLILIAPARRDLIHTLSRFSYRAIQIGVLLLFLGTMLGGFWAAESWGRFWGWDPKEVWALIALLCYLIPLHGRYVGWVGDFGLSVAAVVCFSSVVMAWYGVNFVLGAGLHSYGFGAGDDRWIYLAGLVNISLVVHGAWRYLAARPLSERLATGCS